MGPLAGPGGASGSGVEVACLQRFGAMGGQRGRRDAADRLAGNAGSSDIWNGRLWVFARKPLRDFTQIEHPMGIQVLARQCRADGQPVARFGVKGGQMFHSGLHYRRILFPIDFSLRCRQMAPLVGDVARKFYSEVILLHVLDPLPVVCYAPEFTYFAPAEFIEKQRQTMMGELEEFAQHHLSEVTVKPVSVAGDAAECITAQAARNEVDVIMMPTHGRGIFRRLLLGSVTAKVLHDCPFPMWTMAHGDRQPRAGHPEIRRILCAMDTGIENVRVLEVAASLAYEYDAEVHLIHAIPGQEAYYENTIDPALRQFLMRTAREKICGLQKEAGTDWELCVKPGPVAETVRQMAEEYGADVVIIGRGRALMERGGVRERLEAQRTHSTGIIRESPCPVLSV